MNEPAFSIDEVAKELALRRYALADGLHVPIAAVDERAISTYVGEVSQVLSGGSSRKALLILAKEAPPRDTRFPIWDIKGSDILNQRLQVWVDVTYTRYRAAYRAAFPADDLGHRILSHARNRRMAAWMGFQFVRRTSRGANSSSSFSEQWGVALHSEASQIAANRRRGAFISYADLSELMLMLDMNLGGGVMNAVNEGQKLVRPRGCTRM
jgi:hypothetical protein